MINLMGVVDLNSLVVHPVTQVSVPDNMKDFLNYERCGGREEAV